jgi:amino acid permease
MFFSGKKLMGPPMQTYHAWQYIMNYVATIACRLLYRCFLVLTWRTRFLWMALFIAINHGIIDQGEY